MRDGSRLWARNGQMNSVDQYTRCRTRETLVPVEVCRRYMEIQERVIDHVLARPGRMGNHGGCAIGHARIGSVNGEVLEVP